MLDSELVPVALRVRVTDGVCVLVPVLDDENEGKAELEPLADAEFVDEPEPLVDALPDGLDDAVKVARDVLLELALPLVEVVSVLLADADEDGEFVGGALTVAEALEEADAVSVAL